MVISATELQALLASFLWPLARISGICLTVPVLNARQVPKRVRALFAIVLTVLLVPNLPALPQLELFSAASGFIVLQQLLLGLLMGFIFQLALYALVVGAQTIAMSMGLGFAVTIDSSYGASVPVLSQFFLIFGTLLFLTFDAHLDIIDVLAQSFVWVPVGLTAVTPEMLWGIAGWGGTMFAAALQLALPALLALLIINISFGIVSRAAPTLNLFAVGFPVSMLMGFLILLVSFPNIVPNVNALFEQAFEQLAYWLGGTP